MKKIMLLLIAVVSVIDAYSLTLLEARSLAVENYPIVRDYNLIKLTEQYTVENAAKAWLPQVKVGAQATLQTDVAAFPEMLMKMINQQEYDMKGMSKFQWKAQVDVQQIIWDGGRIKAAQDVAKCQAEETRLSNEVELYQLNSRVDDIYFGLLLLSKQQETLQSSIDLLKANLDRVNSLVRNGAAMQCDADVIEAEMLSVEQQHISIESLVKAYRAILNIYIGDKAQEQLEMPPVLVVPPLNDSRLRPEQQLMSARQTSLQAKQKQVSNEIMPEIGAFAQGYLGYPGMNYMDAMISRRASLNAIIGVSVSWNIGSLYTRKNKLLTFKTASERIDVARRVFEFNTDIQATQQRTEIDRLREISEKDKSILELRSRVRKASEARLREGIVEPTDLLLRIADEKNALISADTHLIQYLKTIYQLQNTLNYE